MRSDSEPEVDLSAMPYDEWLAFVFDHPAPRGKEHWGKEWYWDVDFTYPPSDPTQLVEHVTRLCREFADVAQLYSLPQLNQGIWMLLGQGIEFGDYLLDPAIPLEKRVACVEAMYCVYADFVAPCDAEELETCFQMWWDLLGETLPRRRKPEHIDRNEDACRIRQAVLETLTRILSLDDRRCQEYALHGLGHLAHPRAKEIVQRYIDDHGREWTDEGRAWLEACRDGTVV